VLLVPLLFGLVDDLGLALNLVKSIFRVDKLLIVLLILLGLIFNFFLFHVKHIFKITGIVAREIHLGVDGQLLIIFLDSFSFICLRVVVD